MRCRDRPAVHTVRRLAAPKVPGPCPSPGQRCPKGSARVVDAQGEVEVEQARLDCRFAGPPLGPLVYRDVVVTHPEGSARLHMAADADEAAAAGAADDKHRRYPASLLPGGRQVPFPMKPSAGGDPRRCDGLAARLTRSQSGTRKSPPLGTGAKLQC